MDKQLALCEAFDNIEVVFFYNIATRTNFTAVIIFVVAVVVGIQSFISSKWPRRGFET